MRALGQGVNIRWGVAFMVFALLPACSSSESGSRGAAGAAGLGGSASTGGGSGAGGSSGFLGSPVGQCSPGFTYPTETAFAGMFFNCYGYKSSAPDWSTQDEVDVRELWLKEPMVAGTPYAFSTELRVSPDELFEIWGNGAASSSSCVDAGELLYRGPAQEGSLCVTLQPKANHEQLLIVMAGPTTQTYAFLQFTSCPTGTCPN